MKYFILAGSPLFLFLFLPYGYTQGLHVLPFPTPIENLETVPPVEETEVKKEEQIEEAPATEFKSLVPPDFRKQKVMGYAPDETFRVPEGLKKQVEFWKSIYRNYPTSEYVLHDDTHMVIYKTVYVGDIEQKIKGYRELRRQMQRRINNHKRQLRALLRSIHEKQGRVEKMSDEERRIFEAFKEVDESKKFLKAARNIRAQLGQKERFQQGIIWAGRYLEHMEKIFEAEGVPLELTRLPFVESSFNIKARSKVGASGIWQFIRSTGKRFLAINDAVDERNDPLESSRAAARFLRQNFELLKHWPLAVTAYNHGPSGIKRAVQRVGSTDIVEINRRYKSGTYGFASRNFYASFLAALDTELNYEQYFGPLKAEAPLRADEIKLSKYVGIHTLTKYTGLSKEVLKRYNPALTNYVFAGRKLIPVNYHLRLPPGTNASFLEAMNRIPDKLVAKVQKRQVYHRVKKGDTLYYLSRRYNTTIRSIREANQISSHIYTGQVLVIPD